MSCWISLGIEPTRDQDAIRSAYRTRLPEHHPETDPQGFQALREAYEAALKEARSVETADADDEQSPARELLDAFDELFSDGARRFDPAAWRSYIERFDSVSLEVVEALRWSLLERLIDSGPISNNCARLLAERLDWQGNLLRIDNVEQVEAFIERIAQPDLFDTATISSWPPPAQIETLWYLNTLEHLYQERPLDELRDFVNQPTCLPLPNDDAWLQRLLVQLTQADVASKTFYALCAEKHRHAPDNVDWLYLLARQCSALGLEEQALSNWLRLWREHQHPQAAQWLLELCGKHQPQRLPLLIQAFDRREHFRDWPNNLSEPAQAWGSPAQRPETLTRWLNAGRQNLGGLAGAYVNWRLDGDELPLLALLLDEPGDAVLTNLYRQAWALHRGDTALLERLLAEPDSNDVLDSLVLEGLKYQAEQHLYWLQHAPIPQALTAFINAPDDSVQLNPLLGQDLALDVTQHWLRRLKAFTAAQWTRLDSAFEQELIASLPFGVKMLALLNREGVVLPPQPDGEQLWEWHRQALFFIALMSDPLRWLTLISPALLHSMRADTGHPLSRVLPLLQRVHQQEGHFNGLLGWLSEEEPVQNDVALNLLTVPQALGSARLLSNTRLYDCVVSDYDTFSDDLLGLMLLCGVLYQDPTLDAEQHRVLLNNIAGIACSDAWFESFRDGLIKGEPVRPPREILEEQQGIDSSAFYLGVDTLRRLVLVENRTGVPRTKVLRQLQQAKDDPRHGPGLRLALAALLSWSERLMLARSGSQPVSEWNMLSLNSRLGRVACAQQSLMCQGLAVFLSLASGNAQVALGIVAVTVLVQLSIILRRLHDIGFGVAMLLIGMALTIVLPFLPLVLLVLPGDSLPNRYGVPPGGEKHALEGGLQAALRRLNA